MSLYQDGTEASIALYEAWREAETQIPILRKAYPGKDFTRPLSLIHSAQNANLGGDFDAAIECTQEIEAQCVLMEIPGFTQKTMDQ